MVSHEHGAGSGKCKEIFSRLSEYLDEELDPGVCEKVDAHMDGCDPDSDPIRYLSKVLIFCFNGHFGIRYIIVLYRAACTFLGVFSPGSDGRRENKQIAHGVQG